MWLRMIEEYLEEHNTAYKSQYSYYGCDRIDENVFKFHYYLLNQQFLRIDLFFTITFEDVIQVKIKDGLLDYERNSLVVDGLKRIKTYLSRPSTLSFREVEALSESRIVKDSMTSQDMIYVYNYILYHLGKNPDEIYHFYSIYMRYLENLFAKRNYKEIMISFNWLLDELLHEKEVMGMNIKYLDQEYLMHQAYIRSIFNMIDPIFETMYLQCKQEFVSAYKKIFTYWRFAYSIYTALEKQAATHSVILGNLILTLGKDRRHKGLNLIIEMLACVMEGDTNGSRQKTKEAIALFIEDIKTFANNEEQISSVVFFLQIYGFDLLLELFEETYDSFIFSIISIKMIPIDFRPMIKEALEEGIRHYAFMIKDNSSNSIAINQITNINYLLLMEFSN